MQGEKKFHIKTFKPKHECGMRFQNHLVTSSYIATKHQQRMSDDTKWSIPAMQKELRRELKVDLSKHKLYRAKRNASDNISSDIIIQYTRLRDYCVTVQKYNPNIKIFLVTQKAGFVSGCRPIIGLDGCFLKGSYGRQVLVAVGKDRNENMFPIAMAVVEAENLDSWTWFLKSLIDDIGDGGDMGWIFTSDRQKRLEAAFEIVVPTAKIRHYVRHMYDNFKKLFRGKLLKDGMSTSPQ